MTFSSAFCALVGKPNVGKSTLLNRLVGQKVAITSSKPQTTRNRILGVLSGDGYQMVFIDTPGIHKPRHLLGKYMVSLATATLTEVDVILFLVEATALPTAGDRKIAAAVTHPGTPTVLVVNKIDRCRKHELLPVLDAYSGLGNFEAVVPVSALNGENVDRLLEVLRRRLQPGPQFYPDGTVTDQPEAFIVAEVVREKVLQLTEDEVPHAVAVQVEEVARRQGETVYIRANVYVERPSQKGILIGRGGRMLKEIGRLAREELQALLGSPIYLELWIKVVKDWRERGDRLRDFGYRRPD